MTNDWGADPSVQRMRRIFNSMEEIDNALIKSTGLSPFDTRLREIRTDSRILFEKSFSCLLSKGIHPDDRRTIELYRHCHINTFNKNSISISDSEENTDKELAALIKEVAG